MKKILLLLLLSSIFLEAKERIVIIKISGMSCPLCTMAIKKSLKNTDGVKKARISLPKKEATILFETTQTNTTHLLNAIKKVGYSGEIVHSNSKNNNCL